VNKAPTNNKEKATSFISYSERILSPASLQARSKMVKITKKGEKISPPRLPASPRPPISRTRLLLAAD
jgi:hypothetical protein